MYLCCAAFFHFIRIKIVCLKVPVLKFIGRQCAYKRLFLTAFVCVFQLFSNENGSDESLLIADAKRKIRRHCERLTGENSKKVSRLLTFFVNALKCEFWFRLTTKRTLHHQFESLANLKRFLILSKIIYRSEFYVSSIFLERQRWFKEAIQFKHTLKMTSLILTYSSYS